MSAVLQSRDRTADMQAALLSDPDFIAEAIGDGEMSAMVAAHLAGKSTADAINHMAALHLSFELTRIAGQLGIAVHREGECLEYLCGLFGVRA